MYYSDKLYGWLDLYRDEEELVKALAEVDVQLFDELCNRNICRGYRYITSMVRTLNAGLQLSEPQMRQLKRLSKQVKIYHESKDLRKHSFDKSI